MFYGFLFAAVAAVAMAALVHVGLATVNQKGDGTAHLDMTVMAAISTFVSMMVAQHPEWLL